MACFFACFGSSKDAKRVKHPHNPHLRDKEPTIQRNLISKPVESSFYSLQDESNKPLCPVMEAGNKREVLLNISTTEEVTFDSNVRTDVHVLLPHEEADSVLAKKEENNSAKASKGSSSEDFAVPTRLGSCLSSHRYRNCRDSDDEDEVLDNSDIYLANAENDKVRHNDFLADDQFGMVESRRDISVVAVISDEVDSSMTVCGSLEKELNPIGFNGYPRRRTAYICPVLNPVENLPQWNAVKLKGTLPPTPQKENLKFEQDSPTFFCSESTIEEFSFGSKLKADQPKQLNQEMPVDASLSNWLVSSETTPVRKTSTTTMALDTFTPVKSKLQGSSSLRSHEGEDRPTLGALTLQELEQFSSSTNSPRKSPSQSINEMPIVGTVGTYWSHRVTDKDHDSASSFKGIPNTTSKYREDKTVNWHSTPFETRLERALNRGVAKI